MGGVVLANHYVHWHCSPTRRSFLTGRLPIHHGEMLSGVATDDIELRWQMISQKLSSVGYRCLAYGKGHTGFLSMQHLWTNRGFEHWTGFMAGAQSYTSDDRWQDDGPYANQTYATYLYGEQALASVAAHDAATPLFLYLPDQAVRVSRVFIRARCTTYTTPEGDALYAFHKPWEARGCIAVTTPALASAAEPCC